MTKGEPTIPYSAYELKKWELVARFGWTLPDVEALSIGDFDDYEAWKEVQDAIRKGHNFLRPQTPKPPKRRR